MLREAAAECGDALRLAYETGFGQPSHAHMPFDGAGLRQILFCRVEIAVLASIPSLVGDLPSDALNDTEVVGYARIEHRAARLCHRLFVPAIAEFGQDCGGESMSLEPRRCRRRCAPVPSAPV